MSTDVLYDAAAYIIRQRIEYALGRRRCKSKAALKAAVSWVLSNSVGPGSFLRWAHAADVDAYAIRAEVKGKCQHPAPIK